MKLSELRSRKWRPRCRNTVNVGIGALADDDEMVRKMMTPSS